MGRKLSNRERVRKACGNVVLDRLPGLPRSLQLMLSNGRRGRLPRADLGQLKQWAEDLQKYAAELGLYAEVASKHDYLRVHYFIYTPDGPPAVQVCGPRQLELLGEALEVCSGTGSNRKPRTLKIPPRKSLSTKAADTRQALSLAA